MPIENQTNVPLILSGVATSYPEKTYFLGQVFQDTTNSYKLVWFLAILSLLNSRKERSFRLKDIFTEMGVLAWHPVCLFRLSLGCQDKLQESIMKIQATTNLSANANADEIRKSLITSPELRQNLDFLSNYVPTRFLAPWFADKLRGEPDYRRSPRIKEMAKECQRSAFACPYYLEDDGDGGYIRLNKSWCEFITENFGIVLAFAEHNFALYLQARNPNVPGVVNKLRAPAPSTRQLRTAREFWRTVRQVFGRTGKSNLFSDIYSQNSLGEDFAIDHFLPWSFVVHNLLWNLTPVEPRTNSKKSDVLPDLETYLPRLVRLHFSAIEASFKRPKFLEDYTDCFKQEPEKLVALGEHAFLEKYREIIIPQARIAMNQGFQSGWILKN